MFSKHFKLAAEQPLQEISVATANELSSRVSRDCEIELSERRNSAALLEQQFSSHQGLSMPPPPKCTLQLNYPTATTVQSQSYSNAEVSLGNLSLDQTLYGDLPNWRPSHQTSAMWGPSEVNTDDWMLFWQNWQNWNSSSAPLATYQSHF